MTIWLLVAGLLLAAEVLVAAGSVALARARLREILTADGTLS